MHPDEIAMVFDEAADRGIRRMVVSHPDFVIGATPEQCHQFVAKGAFIEHEYGMYDPEGYRKWSPAKLLDWIREVGAENTVLSSDLGQAGRPAPADALRRVASALLDLGLTPEELRLVTSANPAFLIGLEADPPTPRGVSSEPARQGSRA